MKPILGRKNHMANMQNFKLQSLMAECIAGRPLVTWVVFVIFIGRKQLSLSFVVPYAGGLFHARCKLSLRTSLHSLVQVTSFVRAERVKGGHNKLPVEGAACEQPLGLFGVTGVGILHKNLSFPWVLLGDEQRNH